MTRVQTIDPQHHDSLWELVQQLFAPGSGARSFAISGASSGITALWIWLTGRRNRRATDRGVEVDNTGKIVETAIKNQNSATALMNEINRLREEDRQRHRAEMDELRKFHAEEMAAQKDFYERRLTALEKRIDELEALCNALQDWSPPEPGEMPKEG